ncbi:MAG TPA: ABC transporter permease [Candidatus Limnocylindrales bacterium]|nr:ABC transporter permease [Candidatus Limnocylindrales bacterium]
MTRGFTRWAAPTGLFIGLLAAWEAFIVVTNQPGYVVPHLTTIAGIMIARADILVPATWVTLQEVVAGFVLGVAAGLALAVAIAHSKVVGRAVYPIVITSQAIPVIAIAPVLVIWFGFGMLPKVLVAALICFFPVVINTTAGLLSVEREMIDLMHSLLASRWATFWKVSLPTAMPYVFVGLKNAAVISAIGAIVGEWVGAERGLGPLMIAANASFQTALVFAAITYLAAIAVVLFLLVTLAERIVIPWYFLTRRRDMHSVH